MLTKDQNRILKEAIFYLLSEKRVIISGSAGVGKTFMVNELIKQLPENLAYRILCTAPTNKAVAVLSSKIDKAGNISMSTTHSGLELKMHINYRTGERSFIIDPRKEKDSQLKTVSLLIIDEASMVSTLILEYIEVLAKKHGFAVLFLGDEKQLNPVGEDKSPVFHAGYPKLELTQIIRQAGDNPIISLSRNLGRIFGGDTDITEDGYGILYMRDLETPPSHKNRIVEKLAEVNGSDDLKYLAWTNKEVDNINFLVRKEIYSEPQKIELNEGLIFNAPFGGVFYTNEEIKVQTLSVKTVRLKYPNSRYPTSSEPATKIIDIKYYEVNKDISVTNCTFSKGVPIIHEDSEKDFKALKTLLKSKAKDGKILFRDMYKFIELFAEVKYNHAITVHKSQGSTYRDVIVNIRNIKMNRNREERKRMFYTAITRASHRLILYNV
jgi:hypothetical protein